jgi:hypothetical protein
MSRPLGATGLMSAISAAISYSQDSYQGNGNYCQPPRFSDELSQALGQQFGRAAAKLLEKNLDIAPTLKIRPGYRFSVLLIKDFVFPGPYEDFQYPRVRNEGRSLPPAPAVKAGVLLAGEGLHPSSKGKRVAFDGTLHNRQRCVTI